MKRIFTAPLFVLFFIAAGIFAALAAPAHAWGNASDNRKGARAEQELSLRLNRLLRQGEAMHGLPNIVNFFERASVKMLYELRDDPNFRTHTYIMTLNGDLVKICDSVGFGINASIQYSNPLKVLDYGDYDGVPYQAGTLPQAEPNGLFMPEGLAATYVMCVDSKLDKLQPVYLEPEIIVSPFELKGIGQ